MTHDISKPKIAMIGAGSAVFSFQTFHDIVSSPELEDCEVCLMDINEERLKFAYKVVERLVEGSKRKIRVEMTTNRKKALEGADFVIVSIERDRKKTWTLDWEIPVKYGIRQVIGECGGPGGLSHTLRVVPDIRDICRDMEDLCPNALLLNYTNPEGRVCLAITRYSKIKAVGLCPGIYEQLESISKIMNVDPRKHTAMAYGLNHFTWIKSLRFKEGGDAYPLLKDALERNPEFQPLCRELFKWFGLYPSPSDTHVGEYVPYGWEFCPEEEIGLNWINKHFKWTEHMQSLAERLVSGDLSFNEADRILKGHFVKGQAINVIKAIVADKPYLELAVNIPNQGNITNLPEGVIVEVPALIDGSGVHGLSMGDLPKPIAAFCNIQVTIQELAVEAAVTGSYETALQALLIDPVVQSVDAAKKALDELLNVHAPYLPQFKSKNQKG
jgi:alpha-galactosidase